MLHSRSVIKCSREGDRLNKSSTCYKRRLQVLIIRYKATTGEPFSVRRHQQVHRHLWQCSVKITRPPKYKRPTARDNQNERVRKLILTLLENVAFSWEKIALLAIASSSLWSTHRTRLKTERVKIHNLTIITRSKITKKSNMIRRISYTMISDFCIYLCDFWLHRVNDTLYS